MAKDSANSKCVGEPPGDASASGLKEAVIEPEPSAQWVEPLLSRRRADPRDGFIYCCRWTQRPQAASVPINFLSPDQPSPLWANTQTAPIPPLSLEPPIIMTLPSADSPTEGADFPIALVPTSFLSSLHRSLPRVNTN